MRLSHKEGTGLASVTNTDLQYSFARRVVNGLIQDGNNNTDDFRFIDTNGTNIGAGQKQGTPGPENLSSPAFPGREPQIRVELADPGVPLNAIPNTMRVLVNEPWNNASFGKLHIMRKITNIGGAPITYLRFRIVDMSVFPEVSGGASLHPFSTPLSLNFISSGGTIQVHGTTLETPPAQSNGGGINSSMRVESITPANPLAPGQSIYVQFGFGIQQLGCERIIMDLPVRHFYNCGDGAFIDVADLRCDSFTAVGSASPVFGYAAMRVWNLTDGGKPLIDSYNNEGVPAVYAQLSLPYGLYTITGSFPHQPRGHLLQARIYRTNVAAFSQWDNTAWQDVFFVCTQTRVFLPAVLKE